jgi:hypothetical protein
MGLKVGSESVGEIQGMELKCVKSGDGGMMVVVVWGRVVGGFGLVML